MKLPTITISLLALLTLPGCGVSSEKPMMTEMTDEQIAEREARHERQLAETKQFDAANK